MDSQRIRIKWAVMFATACALPAIAPTASAAEKSPPVSNVTIAFAAHNGIEDWEADGDRGLWIQSRDRKWYYARFFAPCFGLPFHEALRFKFGPGGELDRWSEVYTHDSGRCAFTSLVASDGPPRKLKPAKPVAAPAAPAPPAPAPAAPAPPAPVPPG